MEPTARNAANTFQKLPVIIALVGEKKKDKKAHTPRHEETYPTPKMFYTSTQLS